MRLTDDPGDDQSPDFSPDGETIIFQSNRDHMCDHDNCDEDIFVMNAWTGQNVTRLTGAPGDDRRIDQHPAYFPDSRGIVFHRIDLLNEFGPQDHWTLDLAGRTERQLTQIGTSEGQPAVSRDGTEVAFQGRIEQEQDSDRIVYFSDTDDTFNLDLYLIDSDGSNRVQLTTNAGIQDHPDFGPPADPIKVRFRHHHQLGTITRRASVGLGELNALVEK